MKILIKLSEKITGFSEKLEKIKNRLPEIIALVTYCVGHLMMCLVHEPWFDEALAWLIARDSSIKTVLLEATHYEGHPALWHLVLMPFAKGGAPYELSLSFVSLMFSGTAVALILFRSPFKRIVRIFIPFTYFIFYQFSVVSRPYCMMMLAFSILAVLYKNKDEKPGRYIAALAFLCATSAYGIVIAGGLCIVWLIEMWIAAPDETKNISKNHISNEGSKINYHFESDQKEDFDDRKSNKKNRFSVFLSKLFYKGKFFYLSLLLGYVLTIIWRILPAEDAYASMRATEAEAVNGPLARFVYTFFTSVSDLFLTNVYCSFGTLRDTDISTLELWIGALIGAGILAAIVYFGKKHGKLLTFVVPYLMFGTFASIVYLYYHHIGIELLLIGFFIWICLDMNESEPQKNCADAKEEKNSNVSVSGLAEFKVLLPKLTAVVGAIFALIPLYWCIASCICDVKYSYSYGRSQYEYLRDNDLLDSTIFCEWSKVFDTEVDGYDSFDVSFSMQAVCIAPYLEDGKIYNRMASDDLSYALIHKVNNSSENKEMIENMSEFENPDIILGMPEIGLVFGLDRLNFTEYERALDERSGIIWKGLPGATSATMYVRKNRMAE